MPQSAQFDDKSPVSVQSRRGGEVLLHPCPVGALGTWENVVISVLRASPSPGDLLAISDLVVRLGKSCPQGIASLTVLGAGVASASPGVRSAAMTAMRETRSLLRARALVLEGGGFWASAVRSTLVGLGYLTGRNSSLVVTTSAQEAIAHLARHQKRGVDWQNDLFEALSIVRRQQ